jgi:threonine dehydratase
MSGYAKAHVFQDTNPLPAVIPLLSGLQAYAVQKAVAEGLTFIPPYDDPHTISGQGTIGDEILRQVGEHVGVWPMVAQQQQLTDVCTPCGQVGDMDALDAIFVPVGGGGLIAGIAAYVRALKPHIKVCPTLLQLDAAV